MKTAHRLIGLGCLLAWTATGARAQAPDFAAISNAMAQAAAGMQDALAAQLGDADLQVLTLRTRQALGELSASQVQSQLAAVTANAAAPDHAGVVAAYRTQFTRYADDTVQRAASAARWPDAQNPQAWRTTATQTIEQARVTSEQALRAGASPASALHMVATVRGWTEGQSQGSQVALFANETQAADALVQQRTQAALEPTFAKALQTAAADGNGQTATSGTAPPPTTAAGGTDTGSTTAPTAAAQPPPAAGGRPGLRLEKTSYAPGELVRVTIENPPAEKFAWIGFYREGAAAEHYVKYNLLKNLDHAVYEDVRAPDEPGRYRFRLFRDEGYVPVAESGVIVVHEGE